MLGERKLAELYRPIRVLLVEYFLDGAEGRISTALCSVRSACAEPALAHVCEQSLIVRGPNPWLDPDLDPPDD